MLPTLFVIAACCVLAATLPIPQAVSGEIDATTQHAEQSLRASEFGSLFIRVALSLEEERRQLEEERRRLEEEKTLFEEHRKLEAERQALEEQRRQLSNANVSVGGNHDAAARTLREVIRRNTTFFRASADDYDIMPDYIGRVYAICLRLRTYSNMPPDCVQSARTKVKAFYKDILEDVEYRSGGLLSADSATFCFRHEDVQFEDARLRKPGERMCWWIKIGNEMELTVIRQALESLSGKDLPGIRK